MMEAGCSASRAMREAPIQLCRLFLPAVALEPFEGFPRLITSAMKHGAGDHVSLGVPMNRIAKLAAILLAASLAAAAFILPAAADTDDFFGRWSNTNPNTRDITRVEIGAYRDGPALRVYGACTPAECEWGKVEANIYTGTVGGNPYQDGKVMTGSFDAGFARKLLILRRVGPDRLRYEILNHFKDGSGRSDYYVAGELARDR